MTPVYKARELDQRRSVRQLNGPGGVPRHPRQDEPSDPADTPCSDSSRPPTPSNASLERLQRLLSQAVSSFRGERQRLLNSLKPDIVALTMEISEALIDRELQTDEEAVIRVIDRALADLGEAERVVLKVHPEDARLLRAAEAEDSLSPSSISHFDIVADASIRRGGCMLESDRGQIDATIEARFEEIERHLQGTTGAVSP